MSEDQATILSGETVWSGEIRLEGTVVVAGGATLTVRPGTRVQFALPEPRADADPPPWLLVLGRLEAEGTAEQPIVFSPEHSRVNGAENMVEGRDGSELRLSHCRFERGPWALHLHHSRAAVTDCAFVGNFGGIRFKGGEVAVRGSRFEGNRLGARLWWASPVFEENAFVGNGTGIFFREGVERPVLRRNSFDNREYDINLGELQETDIDASGNWWRASASGLLAERIFDGADSEGVGRVLTTPELERPWTPAARQ